MPDCALLASSSERERGERIQDRRRTEGADVRLTFKREQRSEPPDVGSCRILNQPRKPATSITTGCWTFHAAGPGDIAGQLWYRE